ncbi:unnamed protein product, partial [Iphiclides podalirius]
MSESAISDRWTNNINYRQLVMSSCIGIVQLWWHPYLHDLRKFIPFVFLYNVFSVVFGYPLLYLELALGVVTKKGVLNCWDMAPIARGVGFAMIASCALTALATGVVSAWCLALFAHSFHAFLPWLHCAAIVHPACAARHRPLPEGSETPSQSFFFVLGAIRLDGASSMFRECDWGVLFEGTQIWRDALEYCLVQMTVSQGVLVMMGSHCPKEQHKLATTALITFVISKASCMCSAFVLAAAHGALRRDYDNETSIWPGTSSSMVLWADFVARIPGSQFWSALVFFTLFVVALSTTGGLYVVNFIMTWPVSKVRAPIACVFAMVITYIYGQTTFCEEVYFAVGEYPCVFMRISWAIAPVVLLVTNNIA